MSEDHATDFAAQLELAWAAGFFDGEGCTTLDVLRDRRFQYVRLSIKQVVAANLERFRAAVGGLGNVSPPRQESPKGRPICKYTLAGTGARAVLNLLWPYLGEAKREQATRVLTAEVNGGGVAHSKRTHCPRGHAYDEANTRVRPTGRQCRACDAADQRERRKAAKRPVTEETASGKLRPADDLLFGQVRQRIR
jgi:hypothetical protein